MTDVGRTGEAVAAKYYQQRGWLLLNHNRSEEHTSELQSR